MRTVAPAIWDRWNSTASTTQFIGDDGAPHGRVTVEKDWYLNTLSNAGAYKKTPVRWWQRADNSQVETELPNVISIAIDRSLDNDAGSCTITMRNTFMPDYGDGDIQPGYYTWSHGDSPEARARWGQVQNAWHDVIVPNALLRTYQGYGGRNKTRAQALDDGNIILSGTWLVDTVTPKHDGTIDITCRDMAKLLIEQQVFPPLVPDRYYPLEYYRWVYHTSPAVTGYDHDTGMPDADHAALSKRAVFSSSSAPTTQLGHPTAHALDGNPDTYWLSESHAAADEYAYFIVDVGELIDTVYVRVLHNYQVFVSIEEDGQWQADGGALVDGTPYSAQFGATNGYFDWFPLPRSYRASKVRFTFTQLHTDPNWTGHRAAVYDLAVGALNATSGHKYIPDIALAPNDDGYYLVGGDGGVFPFGPGTHDHGGRAGNIENSETCGIALTPSGNGYWIAGYDGGVFSFGDAAYHGSVPGLDINLNINTMQRVIAITPTADGGGYWLVSKDGAVYSFGNAVYHGNAMAYASDPLQMRGIVATPSGHGYYIFRQDGAIYAFGDAVAVGGSPAGVNNISAMALRPQNDGYWLVGEDGGVFAYGGADFYGSIPSHVPALTLADPIYGAASTSTGLGYVLVGGDGGVFCFGDARFYGSLVIAVDWQTNGNYLDYTDIVRDMLLWSGWWLYDPTYPANGQPAVYGNLESTGVYALDSLKADQFDKKPVIDTITMLKEIVGYLFFVDDEGAAHFESPNWWSAGNFDEYGVHTRFIPAIDERHNLMTYGVSYTDQSARSEVIITTEDPTADYAATICTRFRPPSAAILRGQCRPAMWVNGLNTNKAEQKIMAELISLHIWFSMRTGTAQAIANPAIQINDQVQIFERTTGELYVHYVNGVKTDMNLEDGTYTMDLTTIWLGDEREWAITRSNVGNSSHRVQISDDLWNYLKLTNSRSVTYFRLEQGAA